MPKRLLYTALDWGLGHASRSVPVVRELLAQDHEVILGVTPLTERIFQEEFPDLLRFNVPPLEMEYSGLLPVWLSVLFDYPRLKRIVEEDEYTAAEMVKRYRPDVIISDSRYGFRSESVKNIFITHQLEVKSPVGEKAGNKIAQQHLKRFNEIWVPDAASVTNNLSGELSHGNFAGLNIKFIGPQSRLNTLASALPEKFDFLFLLSGPEPKRTQLEKEVIEFISESKFNCCLVRGSDAPLKTGEAVGSIFNFPDKEQLSKLVKSSEYVVARSGYSTIMDVVLMKKKAFLLPTSGQTEQEYLAAYLNGKYGLKQIEVVSEILQINQQQRIPTQFFDCENFLAEAVRSL